MWNINALADLQQGCWQQQKFSYLFFWGHTPKQAGTVDKAVLSQWYPAPFVVADVHDATAEHYMMAEKARLFEDEDIRQRIIAESSPRNVKALGRMLSGFDEAIWQQHRQDIVYRGNRAKFSQHTELKKFLLATGNQVLVEASPVDHIWGIGMAENDPDCCHPLLWRGLNLLGFTLMKVRADLMNE